MFDLSKNKFNIVLFASEGTPHDRGFPIYNYVIDLKEKILKENSKINNIEIYTPQRLKSLGYDYHVKEYENTGCITMNKNMQYIGFSAWRPLILLLELEKMNDGEILVYRDSNYKKYKELENYDNIYEMSNMFLDKCKFDIFVPFQSETTRLIKFCKKDVIVELGNNNDFFYKVPLIWQSIIVIRKSNISIELLKEWLYACENENLINGECYRDNDKCFKWSCPEQSILNVIIYKWILQKRHNIPENYPSIICPRNFNNYSLLKNYSYLNNIKFNNSVNPNGLNTLWLLWTGSNKMSELRRNCLNDIYRYAEADIILVTKTNLSYYTHINYPLHEAFQYLSDIHKSDYLRYYLMHVYGGAYVDIKPMKFSIKKYAENLSKNNDIIGYNAFVKENVPYPSSFMYKPNTDFTTEVMKIIHDYLDSKLELLKIYPAKHPRHDPKVSKEKKYPYPIGWDDITDKIAKRIIIEYSNKNKIDKRFPSVRHTKYANFYQEDNMITYDEPK